MSLWISDILATWSVCSLSPRIVCIQQLRNASSTIAWYILKRFKSTWTLSSGGWKKTNQPVRVPSTAVTILWITRRAFRVKVGARYTCFYLQILWYGSQTWVETLTNFLISCSKPAPLPAWMHWYSECAQVKCGNEHESLALERNDKEGWRTRRVQTHNHTSFNAICSFTYCCLCGFQEINV